MPTVFPAAAAAHSNADPRSWFVPLLLAGGAAIDVQINRARSSRA
jgi:hypothetical protein